MRKHVALGCALLLGCGRSPAKPTEVTIAPEPIENSVTPAPPHEPAPPASCLVKGPTLGARAWLMKPNADEKLTWGWFEPNVAGEYEARLRAGHPERVEVDFRARMVRIQAETPSRRLWLYLGEPSAFGPVVTVHPGSEVRWSGGVHDEVALSFELGRLFRNAIVTSALPCATLHLERTEAELPSIPEQFSEDMTFTEGGSVPLFSSAEASKPTLEVDTRVGAAVRAGKVQGERREVFVRASGYDVLGWVPSRRLVAGGPRGQGFGSGSGSLRPPRPLSEHVCPDPVPLYVQFEKTHWRVGTLLSHSTIQRMKRGEVDESLAPVRIPRAPMVVASGFTLAAKKTDFLSCPPPRTPLDR